MIGKLRGKVAHLASDFALLDVNGVGYEVSAHARLLQLLEVGAMAELIIETHVREDHIQLFGFSDYEEREWFRLLTSVQRVGARMALAFLGTYTPHDLTHIIMAKDTARLSRISGVGAKLAERVVTELKDKLDKPAAQASMPAISGTKAGGKGKATMSASGAPRPSEEVVSALVNLGYGRTEAFTASARALQSFGEEAPSLQQWITASLKELVRA